MCKRFCGGVFFLILGFNAWAQGPPALETFTSPDGAFQFVYPETYDLLVGERLLRATQGRHQTIPVCDFSMALACVIYPIEPHQEARLEAAGFSVGALPGLTEESSCLAYADLSASVDGHRLQLTSIAIRSRVYRHAFIRKKLPGHLQAMDSYRTFNRQTCYELQIRVSLSDEATVQPVFQSASLGDGLAQTAQESLQLILSSVVFEPQ